jgi:transposase
MRYLGIDVHKEFCNVAVSEGGGVRSAGRVQSTRSELELFAQSLGHNDEVGMEATSNALAVARIVAPHVARVVIADPRNLRAITHAKVKNDRLDARMLAKLLASGMLPETWMPDEETRALRRLVSRRTQLSRQRTRATNQLHAVLIRNLCLERPSGALLSKQGREWLQTLELPADERLSLDGCLREADFLAEQRELVEAEIAKRSLASKEIRRLMTIPGVGATVAATVFGAIGEIGRFPSPRHLVGYLGLDPRIRQSGASPARYGHISKEGSSTARHALCEAAHATMRSPGPLRAFGQRIEARRGKQIATVAVARKLATLSWHLLTKEQDYVYARPALTFRKLRRLELAAGAAKRQNPNGRNRRRTVDNPEQWRSDALRAQLDEQRYQVAVSDRF